jgi:hypothetical protein
MPPAAEASDCPAVPSFFYIFSVVFLNSPHRETPKYVDKKIEKKSVLDFLSILFPYAAKFNFYFFDLTHNLTPKRSYVQRFGWPQSHRSTIANTTRSRHGVDNRQHIRGPIVHSQRRGKTATKNVSQEKAVDPRAL